MVRFPSKTSTREILTSAMCEFSAFIINLCNLVGSPLEGARFTWSSHEEVPILSRIDRFLLLVEWDDHFRGAHQVTLPKIISDHGDVPLVKRPCRFENVWLEVENFPHLVKTWWDQFHISGSPSCVLVKKLNLLKFELKD